MVRPVAGGLRFRDLRHSYATWLVDDGVPPNMVQRVLGHERSSTHDGSLHPRTDDANACSKRFPMTRTVRATTALRAFGSRYDEPC
jgi:integrase